MKRNSIYIFSIIATAAVIASINLSNSDLEKAESERPQVLSMTASVEIPEEMTFAGEKIHFDRYDLRERMDRELNSFTYFHSTTMLLFKRANRIVPIIEPILKQEGVPDDLKYLAVIESSLDPRAVSPARATGLWQLLSGTAQELGLEVSSEVDERYHISKSTVAACRFLKDAYRRYGSWSAAVMSYNGGKARITSELSKQQAEEALDLWLVEETSRYYFRMMAIKSLFENPSKYGFILRGDQLYKPMEFKEVNVSTAIPNLASFARENGITYAQLKDFNSWLRDTKLTNKLGKTYTILIPTRESLYYKKGEKIKIHDKRWVTE
jgi:membrane-bound lytic murein transglycosylase D